MNPVTVLVPQMTFLRLPAVLALIGVSKATLYRWCRLGEFPRAYPLTQSGSTVAWSSVEVQHWIKAKLGETGGTFDGTFSSNVSKAA